MTLCLQVPQGWGLQHLSWTMVGSALLSQHWLACIMSEVANLPQLCLPSCCWHCPSCHVKISCSLLRVHAADLQSLLDDMRTPSSFGNNIKRQKVLHESGDRLNCWRSRVRPLPLALLYSFFGTFSQACRRTAPLHERDKLFVLELCTEVGCC